MKLRDIVLLSKSKAHKSVKTLVPGGKGRTRMEKSNLKQWILNEILLKKIFFPNLSLSTTKATCPNT